MVRGGAPKDTNINVFGVASLQYEGLQSWATDLDLATPSLRWLGAEVPKTLILMYLGLWPYNVGAHSLGPTVLDFATHSLRRLRAEVLRTLIFMNVELTAQCAGLQSRATDFGSRNALLALIGDGGPRVH